MALPRLGVTMYSFNADYYSYRYSLEDAFAAIGSLGTGQGVEIVAPQVMRSFPDPSEEFETVFRRLVDRYGLVPSAYGAYGDGARFPGRWANVDEQVDYLSRQLRAAARMGFPVVRVQFEEAVLTRLVPLAEHLGVRMGMEIHAPMTVEGLTPVLDRVKAIDSAALGIIPDCGAFCHSCAEVYLRRFRDQGVPKDIVEYIATAWQVRTPIAEVLDEVDKRGGGELGRLMADESNIYFGHSEPKALAPLIPYIVHVHGKFFGIDETGTDSAVRFPELVDVLLEGGYSEVISCEYEGHHWDRSANALDQIRTIQSYLRRCFDEKGNPSDA
jgi:sugar phosphate isomerase/epimerase